VPQKNKRWVLLAVTAAALAAAGCMPPNRTEFIEKLGFENRRIARSTRSFRSAIAPLSTGGAADAAGAHSAYNDMVKLVQDVKGEMAVQQLPPASSEESSTAAKNLLQAYSDYLDKEQSILDGPMKQILAQVDDNTISNADKANTVRHLMNDVRDQDDVAYRALNLAQQAYCNAHNYQFQTLDQYAAANKK